MAQAIERRRPRVIAPRWWAVASVLRGVLGPADGCGGITELAGARRGAPGRGRALAASLRVPLRHSLATIGRSRCGSTSAGSRRSAPFLCSRSRWRRAACGVPGNSVADVAGNPITTQAFNHWMFVAAKSQAAQNPGAPVIVPSDPPQFNGCVAQVRRADPHPGQDLGQAAPSRLQAALHLALEPGHGLPDQGLLVPGRGGAGTHQGHRRPGTEAFQTAKNQQFSDARPVPDVPHPDRADPCRTSCSASGSTRSSRSCSPSTRRPSRRALIQQLLQQHRSQFGTPETRDIRIVLAKTTAQANAAKQALQSGQSWDKVAKQYSIDPTTKNHGGLLVGVTQGQQDAALDNAAFSAPLNKLLGPVKGQFGYYVFEVTKITAATQQSLAQATPLIRQTLPASSRPAPRPRSTRCAGSHWRAQDELPLRLRDGRLHRLQATQDLDGADCGVTAPPAGEPVSAPGSGRRGAGAARRDHPPAAGRVPVGPRAGRALDRSAHGRGGL